MPSSRHATFRALLTLVLGLSAAGARAQPADQNGIDPPARVGRLALLLGTVSFHSQDQDAWERATLNYPVTSGNALWTEPGAAADIDVGPAHLVLDQSTELDITLLDDHTLDATQPQGALFLRLRAVAPGDEYRITTPRGVVVIAQPGAYEVVAGDADHATLVTVVEGTARIDSTNASLTLGARQVGRIVGSDTFAASVGTATFDPFLTARLAEERQQVQPIAVPRAAPPPVVLQMTGGAALERVGEWQASATYGRIWYPPVQANWVPYREGHWGYVAPWGWTWIDNSSWGFAPFHYGRWVQEGHRWGWIAEEPGRDRREPVRPVYAPALVSFLNIGVAVTLGSNRAPASVGWIPLGPREVYVPPYHASERYVRDVNVGSVTNVTNITTINRVTTVNTYVNRGAATVVPGSVMTRSQPVAARVEPVNARVLAGARAQHEAPVRPTTATVGVTPDVARQLKLAPPPQAAAGRPAPQTRAAPGPVLPPVPVVAPGAAVHAAPGAAKGAAPGVAPGVAPGAAPGTAQHHVGTAALPALRPVTPAHPPANVPDGRKPDARKPDARKPDAAKPDAAKPGPEKPAPQVPAAASPGAAPAVSRPAAIPAPGAVAPAHPPANVPDARKPDPMKPGAAKPAPEKPAPEKPAPEKPGAQAPGSASPGAVPAVSRPAAVPAPAAVAPAKPHQAAPAQPDARGKPAEAPAARPAPTPQAPVPHTPVPPTHSQPATPAVQSPAPAPAPLPAPVPVPLRVPAPHAAVPPARTAPATPAPAAHDQTAPAPHQAAASHNAAAPDASKTGHEPPQAKPKMDPASAKPGKGAEAPAKPADEPIKPRQ